MQCLQCGAKWTQGNKISMIKSCPICDCNYKINPELKKQDKIQELLLELIREKGLEFCKKQQNINAYLNDYFPEQEDLRENIKNLLEQGIGDFVYKYKTGVKNESIESYCNTLSTTIEKDKIVEVVMYLCEDKEFLGSDLESETFYLEQFEKISENRYKEICLKKAKNINNSESVNFKLIEFDLSIGNIDFAIENLKELADKGNIDAILQLAKIYKTDDYSKKNESKAKELLDKASEKGSLEAEFLLGLDYLFGSDEIRSVDEAEKCFKRVASEKYPEAHYYLYKIYYKNSERKQNALEHLKIAADLDNVSAKYEYAIHLLYGDDMQENVGLAVRLLEDCVEKNEIDAIQKLIYMYMTGFKVPKDKEKAKRYKEKLEDK